eukprot:scaffold305924_cov45-Prasinocladus_malaysianus.AAC.1
MRHATQHLQRVGDYAAVRLHVKLADKSDTAGVFVVGGVVQAPSRRGAVVGHAAHIEAVALAGGDGPPLG